MNAFIRDHLSENEIDLVLMRVAHAKKMGFAEVSFRIECSRLTRADVKVSENPDTFKKLYAGEKRV